MATLTQQPITAPHGGPPQPQRPSYSRSAARTAVPVAVTALLAVLATVWVAVFTAAGQRLDETAMRVLNASRTAATGDLIGLLDTVSTPAAAIALAVIAGVGLLRLRPRLAVAAVVLVIGANLTTQLLKGVIARPDLGIGEVNNSLPSGHTTVVFALAMAAVLVAPRALRWLVGLVGAGVGALTGLATVIAGWHRPSDVVAAMLVTLAWGALASAVLPGHPRDGRIGSGGAFPAVLGAAIAGIGLIVYGFGWSSADGAQVLPVTALVVAGISGLAVGGYASLVSRTSN